MLSAFSIRPALSCKPCRHRRPAPLSQTALSHPLQASKSSPPSDSAPKAPKSKTDDSSSNSSGGEHGITVVGKLEDYAVTRQVPQEVVMLVIDLLSRSSNDGNAELRAVEGRLERTLTDATSRIERTLAELESSSATAAGSAAQEVRGCMAELSDAAGVLGGQRTEEVSQGVAQLRADLRAAERRMRQLVLTCTAVLLAVVLLLNPGVWAWVMVLLGRA